MARVRTVALTKLEDDWTGQSVVVRATPQSGNYLPGEIDILRFKQ